MRRHNDNLIEFIRIVPNPQTTDEPALSRWASVPLLDGVLDTCDEEGRRNPENHPTVGGLQLRNQPQDCHAVRRRHNRATLMLRLKIQRRFKIFKRTKHGVDQCQKCTHRSGSSYYRT
jgi:hypothetical protein